MYWEKESDGLDRPRSEDHLRFLLSNYHPACPAMATFSRSNAFRMALRSPILVGLHRGVASKTYPDHIPLSTFEHAFLTVGTGLAALLDPRRGGECDIMGADSTELMYYD